MATLDLEASQSGPALGPRWDWDGKRLFYRNTDRMMAVDIETDPSFVAGEPRELFRKPFHFNLTNSAYDRSPVDDRFLMITTNPKASESSELIVVQNWSSEIRRLAPIPEAN